MMYRLPSAGHATSRSPRRQASVPTLAACIKRQVYVCKAQAAAAEVTSAAPSSPTAAPAPTKPRPIIARPQPVIILVNPIMPENIGSVARALKNFGLMELRLVAPKDGWTQGSPSPFAAITASHALDVLQSAKLYTTTEEAIADLHTVYASTARSRAMNMPVVLSRDLYWDGGQTGAWSTVVQLPQHEAAQAGSGAGREPADPAPVRVGIMFGRESTGLSNADMLLANKVVTVDSNPVYPVMNLSQAVTVVVYDLYQEYKRHLQTLEAQRDADKQQQVQPWQLAHKFPSPQGPGSHAATAQEASSEDPAPPLKLPPVTSSTPAPAAAPSSASHFKASARHSEPATKQDLEVFVGVLFKELEAARFFEGDEVKTERVQMHMRNLLGRIESLTVQDIRLLHGVLGKLARQGNSNSNAEQRQ